MGDSQRGTSNFSRTPVLLDIYYRSKLECYAFSGLQVDNSKIKRKKKKVRKKKKKKRKNSIHVGVNKHNQKKDGR